MKYRLPRKLKKKFGKNHKLVLGLYIFGKATNTFAKKMITCFQEVLRIAELVKGKLQ